MAVSVGRASACRHGDTVGVRPPCLGTVALCSSLTPIYDGLTQSTETTAFDARMRIRTHTRILGCTHASHIVRREIRCNTWSIRANSPS